MKTNHTNITATADAKAPRSGFTLIELLVVISIIAILLTLVLTAIGGSLRRARIVAVQTEFQQFEQALATFENRFGTLPPSSLVIPAAGSTWNATSRSAVRAMWPQFNFATNGGLGNSTPLTLNGAECLVFFLGGIQSGTPAAPVLSGFSKNPRSPWTASATPEGPFFEFDVSRIVDIDSDMLFEVVDSMDGQTTPLLYLSSRGKRYNKTNTAIADDYDVFTNAASNMQICYFEADGTTPQRRDSYQLISPGEDGEYGPGGVFSPDGDLVDFDIDGNSTIDPDEERRPEKDNITNFSDGTLE